MFGLFTLAILGYGLWELWYSRNKAKFEGRYTTNQAILYKVLFQVKQCCSLADLKEPSNSHRKILKEFGIQCSTPNCQQIKIIRWLCPPWPLLKLNTDGASKMNNEAGGGGAIRNHKGDVLLAFSHYYGRVNSLVAEARALLDGLKYLQTLDCSSFIVECDSIVLVQIIRREVQCPWSILPFVRNIWKLHSRSLNISHVYREGNTVADSLASYACYTKCNSFFFHSELPPNVKGAARLDKLGMPNIRLM